MGLLNTNKLKEQYRTDATIAKFRKGLSSASRTLPSATVQYLVEKAPIIQWLPRYMPKWILSDFIAGLTIAVMLIPQALAYAKIATIPGEFGLYSSWLPAAVYVIMGTSKDLSTGPTSIMGLLTAEVIAELSVEGYAPEAISSAVAMMVGIYALILGIFRLGFVLDYVSEPVLTGFVSAAAITILLGQVGSLVGLDKVGTGTANILNDVFSQIPEMKPLTVTIGITGMLFLYILEVVGKKWGKKNAGIKFLSSSRAVLALVLFTTISFVVNKDLKTPVWAISKVKADGLIPPKAPDFGLLQKVVTKSVAPVVASALEHLAIGKAFGQKNNYVIDQSQELCYLGVTNFFNALFGAMPVGGAMSRTAVNSECGVKSPLSGSITAGFILLTIYKLSGVLFWIPKATLSAIIIMAVVHVIEIGVFFRYWRASFADFTAAMLSFWITLFVSTEMGIAVAVVFSIGYTMVRLAFKSSTISSGGNFVSGWAASSSQSGDKYMPKDTVLVNFEDAMFFPNASRVKKNTLESIQAQHLPLGNFGRDDDRTWSVAAEKRLERLRIMNNITPSSSPLRVLVLNFSRVPFLDVTGVSALKELRSDIEKHMGNPIQIRMIGLSDDVRKRLEREGWPLVDEGIRAQDPTKVIMVYESIQMALWDPREEVEIERVEHYYEEKV